MIDDRFPPTLYIVPTRLSEGDPRLVLPAHAIEVAAALDHFVAENAKSARAFLKAIRHPKPLRDILIEELNEHTPRSRIPGLLAPLRAGVSLGLLADAGCPVVADPGAPLVSAAHQLGVPVRPLVGPSSILLALIASGFPGQRFAFHGYLPLTKSSREERLKSLEAESRQRDQTQIFIEAPYRNLQLLDAMISCCEAETLLCVASDLTASTERVTTRSVASWRARRERPEILRRPAVFLLYAGSTSLQRRD